MKNKWVLAVILVLVVGGAWFVFSDRDDGQGVGTSVGDRAPEFSFTTLDNETISSQELQGKTVVITSSAAWCATCVAEAEEFAKAYLEFSDDDVFFLTVDIDPRNSDDDILEFQSNTNTPWAYANSNGGADVVDKLKLSRFEITYVIDGEGVILYKDSKITSAEELIEAINETL